MRSQTIVHLLFVQIGEWISVTEQGKCLVFLHMTAGCRILSSEIHFIDKTESQAAVICHLHVINLLNHFDALHRISNLIGFQTARSQREGYNQSELKIKASATQEQIKQSNQ